MNPTPLERLGDFLGWAVLCGCGIVGLVMLGAQRLRAVLDRERTKA